MQNSLPLLEAFREHQTCDLCVQWSKNHGYRWFQVNLVPRRVGSLCLKTKKRERYSAFKNVRLKTHCLCANGCASSGQRTTPASTRFVQWRWAFTKKAAVVPCVYTSMQRLQATKGVARPILEGSYLRFCCSSACSFIVIVPSWSFATKVRISCFNCKNPWGLCMAIIHFCFSSWLSAWKSHVRPSGSVTLKRFVSFSNSSILLSDLGKRVFPLGVWVVGVAYSNRPSSHNRQNRSLVGALSHFPAFLNHPSFTNTSFGGVSESARRSGGERDFCIL